MGVISLDMLEPSFLPTGKAPKGGNSAEDVENTAIRGQPGEEEKIEEDFIFGGAQWKMLDKTLEDKVRQWPTARRETTVNINAFGSVSDAMVEERFSRKTNWCRSHFLTRE